VNLEEDLTKVNNTPYLEHIEDAYKCKDKKGKFYLYIIILAI